MPQFTDVPVTDAGSIALLTQYFSDRASTFPSSGGYRTSFPPPEQFVPPRGLFLLVSEESQPRTFVGCGGIRRIDDGVDGAVRFEAKHLWLQPQVRGRGWGSLLLAELEARARALGATEMVLDTNSSLEAAGRLYQRSGYVDVPPYNDNPNATNWYRKALG